MSDLWEYGLPPLQLTVSAPQTAGSREIRWTGEAPPYQLQSCTDLNAGDWQNEGAPTSALSTTVPTGGAAKFFRVLSLFGDAPRSRAWRKELSHEPCGAGFQPARFMRTGPGRDARRNSI